MDIYAGFGVHIQMTVAQAVACAMIDAARRRNDCPPLTADELRFVKTEHVRLVSVFGVGPVSED